MAAIGFFDCVTGNIWDEFFYLDALSEQIGNQRFRKIDAVFVQLDTDYKSTFFDRIMVVLKIMSYMTLVLPLIFLMGKALSRTCRQEKVMEVPLLFRKVTVNDTYVGELLNLVDLDKLQGYALSEKLLGSLNNKINNIRRDFAYFLRRLDTKKEKPWNLTYVFPYVVQLTFSDDQKQVIQEISNDLLIEILKAALLKEFPKYIVGVDPIMPYLYLKNVKTDLYSSNHILNIQSEIVMKTFEGDWILTKAGIKKRGFVF